MKLDDDQYEGQPDTSDNFALTIKIENANNLIFRLVGLFSTHKPSGYKTIRWKK